MKLLIVNSNFKSDSELMEFLAVKSQIEVVMVSADAVAIIRNQKSQTSRIQSFKNLIDGKQIIAPSAEEQAAAAEEAAALNAVNQLAHNKQMDSVAAPMSGKAWDVINNLEHNRKFDSSL